METNQHPSGTAIVAVMATSRRPLCVRAINLGRQAPCFAVALALSVVSLPGQDAVSKPAAAPRITVIGASVSAGFVDGPLTGGSAENDSVSLSAVLKVMWPGLKQPVEVGHRAQEAMFRHPRQSGETQMKWALRDDADVLIGVDFAFWFAYGSPWKDKKLQALDACLKMLEPWKKPLLLGDIPDMTGASRRLLSPRLIPDAKTRDQMNARMREWAKTRPNVTILPLDAWLRELKTDGFVFTGEKGEGLKAPAGSLLQGDNLHVSRLGMAIFATRIADVLRRVMPNSPWTKTHASAAAVSRAVDAEFEYEDLLEDIEAAAAQPKPKAESRPGGGK